jgi:hypothetical protein
MFACLLISILRITYWYAILIGPFLKELLSFLSENISLKNLFMQLLLHFKKELQNVLKTLHAS